MASGLNEAMMKPKVTHCAAIARPKKTGHLLRNIDACRGHFSAPTCLKILPYVFTRPSELRPTQCTEFDFDSNIWTIPAERMKMHSPHVVPLAAKVQKMLQKLFMYSGNTQYLFPSIQARSSVSSDAGPLAALHRLGHDKDDMSLRGFRAMASTNLNKLGHRADVIEVQLAHREPGSARLAYNRAQYMGKRRKITRLSACPFGEKPTTIFNCFPPIMYPRNTQRQAIAA